jgi:hypothetical protein
VDWRGEYSTAEPERQEEPTPTGASWESLAGRPDLGTTPWLEAGPLGDELGEAPPGADPSPTGPARRSADQHRPPRL